MVIYYASANVDHSEVKNVKTKVHAYVDVNEGYQINVKMNFLIPRDFMKQEGDVTNGIMGYWCVYKVSEVDGKIEFSEVVHQLSNLDGIPEDVEQLIFKEVENVAYKALEDLKNINPKPLTSQLRINIEHLIASQTSLSEISNATMLPRTKLHRMLREDGYIDGISLENAELLSAYYESTCRAAK